MLVRTLAVAVAGIAVAAATACGSRVAIGTLCPNAPPDDGATPDPTTPVPVPWSTGFESGFCDYIQPLGFCFATGTGSFEIVTSPVHSGRYAAAFTVGAGSGGQARCVQQGQFPPNARYGAWYYVPAPAANGNNWNLFHFQGGDAGSLASTFLWDVTLNGLHSTLVEFLPHATPISTTVPPIPIGQWFHLEVVFKRASDTSGEITLLQDDAGVMDYRMLITDTTQWGQWYVGNLFNALSPPDSTVYVDDVTISYAQ